MTMEQAIGIGIEKITSAKRMAEMLKATDNKEDKMFILEKMSSELAKGLKEIDEIERSINLTG